jgi:hypothetical protein
MKTRRTPRSVALLGVLLLGSRCLLPIAHAADPPADLIWVYEYLLATADTEHELAIVTDRITFRELPHTALSDFAAEVLVEHLDDPNYQTGNQALLVNLLTATKSDRYVDVIARVRKETKDQTVRRVARESAKTPPRYHQNPFVPGSVDIKTIVSDMKTAALAAKPTAEQANHLSDFPGGSVTELIAWAGRPQQITSLQVSITGGILPVKVQQIGFLYRGIGRVTFGNSEDQPFSRDWLFTSFDADPLAFEQDFPYRAHAAEAGLPDDATLEMMQLTSGSALAMRRSAQINYRRPSPSLEFMDTAAEILATQFQTAQDDASIDAYSWICRVLSGHGGQRYAAILARVAAETPDGKLKRYASLPVEAGGAAPAEPYVTGTVSLGALRAKYPSPYPPAARSSRPPPAERPPAVVRPH